MADIQVIDFLKDVESNRRSLIANAQSKGKIIDNGASLTQAVAINNTITPSASPEKIEVRFFDADGTLLQQSFIDYGGSVTPPANPNYDPDRLTFKRWASAIGERFDNITHDVDYGALYTINDGAYHLFCTFNDTTGYTVTLSPYQTAAHTITIDWGDGTENDTKTNSGTTNISHTYAQAGDYEIIVSSDTPIDYPTYYYCLDSNILSTSSSSNIIDGLINAYMPILNKTNFLYTNGLQTAIIEGVYSNVSIVNISYVQNIILNNSLTIIGNLNLTGYNLNVCIIDNSFNVSEFNSNMFYSKLDKLIIPNSIQIGHIPDTSYSLEKVIVLSPKIKTTGSVSSPYSIKSIQILYNVYDLPRLNSTYSLEEYIYPNSITKINGYLAPYSKLKSVSIPPNCIISNSLLQYMYNIQTLILPQNFNQSLNIQSYQITIPSIIDMLNKVQDNTGGTAQTLTFTQNNIQIQLLNIFVVLDNGIWVQATRNTPNAMNLIEAFNSKNWTIS